MATPEGLKGEESDLRRRTVFVCVAASVGTEAQAQSFMEKQWRHVTCDQAVQRLMGPDLLVTNRKDKEVQVHVLKNLNKQTAEFVTKFLTTLSGIVSLPLLTAFDKFLGSLGSVPLRDLAGDDVLSALLGRVSSDEFSALSTFQDSALELVAQRHRGHPRVSSSTREELEAFIRAAFAGPTAENMNTLFPVFDETLKIQHGGWGEFRLRPSGWAAAHRFRRQTCSSGAELFKMQHGRAVNFVCALPDGRLLTGSEDNFARVFSDTGAELFKMQHGGFVYSICALPDGRLLTGSCDEFARVFSDTGAELFKMQHGGYVWSVCALPDGRLLTGSDDSFARVFSALRACSRTPEPNFSRCSTASLCGPSAPFRMGGCSPVPLTSLHACSRTPEPNFSRCGTAAMCGPSAPFRMGGCSPVPMTSLRACSRTPRSEDGDLAGEKWLRSGVFLEKSLSHLLRSTVIRRSLTQSARTDVVGVTVPPNHRCALPSLT